MFIVFYFFTKPKQKLYFMQSPCILYVGVLVGVSGQFVLRAHLSRYCCQHVIIVCVTHSRFGQDDLVTLDVWKSKWSEEWFTRRDHEESKDRPVPFTVVQKLELLDCANKSTNNLLWQLKLIRSFVHFLCRQLKTKYNVKTSAKEADKWRHSDIYMKHLGKINNHP